MGMAAGLLGTGAQLASGMMDMDRQQKAQKQQQENLNNWYMQQHHFRQMEMARQANLRNQANGARMESFNTVGGIAQKGIQQAEADRLASQYGTGTSAAAPSASDAAIQAGSQAGALTGQGGGDGEFRSDLARRLNNAATDARSRIGALATLNSYGDSFGGLGTVVPMAFQKSGWDINKFNNFRQGSMQAYGVEKAIQPQQVHSRPNGAGMALKAGAGLLGGLGGGGGGMF